MSSTTDKNKDPILMCEEYPKCGLTAYSCDLLQTLVYEDNASERRKMAFIIREDMGEAIEQAQADYLESVIPEKQPTETLPRLGSNAKAWARGFNAAIDQTRANARKDETS